MITTALDNIGISNDHSDPEDKCPMSNKDPTHYVDAEELTKELKIYQESKVSSNKLGRMLMKIVEGVCSSNRFNNYTSDYKLEMKSFAHVELLRTLHKVDTSRTPKEIFNFISLMTFNAFKNQLIREKNYSDRHELVGDYDVSEYQQMCKEGEFEKQSKISNSPHIP